LFRSAQDRVQSVQATLRDRSDRWLVRGQNFADRFSASITRILGTVVFWVIFLSLILGGTAYKYRRIVKTQLQIWQIRWGRGAANNDVVAQLFYRAARLAERSLPKRRPFETWREWIF